MGSGLPIVYVFLYVLLWQNVLRVPGEELIYGKTVNEAQATDHWAKDFPVDS
jgi:hypothetical protein